MNEKNYKTRVKIGNVEIEVEGDKEFVKEEISSLLKQLKSIPVEEVRPKEEMEVMTAEKQPVLETGKPPIKEFIDEKRPSKSLQTAVVLAYYLFKFEKRETFKEEDLKKIWIASGVKPPKKMKIRQTVTDGKSKYGWFEKVSRGQYKLSPHGVYFVEKELPKKKE